MQSKFNGTWVDQGNHHAVIEGANGTVSVHFTDVPERPGFFHGTEEDPGMAAPTIRVKFTDDGEDVVGALGEAGQKIHWSNDTIWTKA